jgi:hypothetical protein
VTTLIRRLGALFYIAASLSVALLGAQVLMAYTGAVDLVIRGPGAAIFVVVAFVLFVVAMFLLGLLLDWRYRARRLQWAAFGLAGAPLPLAGYAIALGGDDAGDPVFRLLLYGLLAGYGLYAAALTAFGRRLAARPGVPRLLSQAGLLLAGAGGFYVAHAAAAVAATLDGGYIFPLLALALMVAGGGLVALAEAAIGIVLWQGPRRSGDRALTPDPSASRSATTGRSPA